ncbi:Fimbrin-2 [Coccomyxa sp. Obi]|nr:Fimbrin-2 [Coccomyxa sp. Obi]
MAASLRALGGRLLSTFTAASGASPEDSEINDDEGLELQVQEKEDVELDVLNLKGREVAVGKDQGHIIDLGIPEAKDGRQRRKTQTPREGEDWKLEDVRVNDSSKAASLASPRSDVSSEAESAKWTLVSRLTSRLAEGQIPAPPSSSGRSTPSNLERAVLLLESEKDHDRAQALAGTSALDQNVAGKTEAKAAVPDRDDADGENAVDLATRRASLRKVTTSGGDLDGDSVEEGPSTPPTGGGPTRSGSLKADTPSSGAGDSGTELIPERALPEDVQEPGRTEMQYYATCINARLHGDEALQGVLPLQPTAAHLISACKDGIMLCKLLNSCVPDSLDERALNLPASATSELSRREALQNNTLCINAAKALGCSLADVTPEDIFEGKEEAVRSCVWQIIRLAALKDVSVKSVPETVVLQRPGEEVSALLDVPAEQLLLRWVAHHIGAAGPAWEAWLPLNDVGPDLADSTALYCLLSQLDAPDLHAINLQEKDLVARAETVLQAAQSLTQEPLPPARGIAEGNADMVLVLLAALFRARHGLERAAAALAGHMSQFAQWLEEYDVQDSREERTFRVWLLSLLRNEVHIQNLTESLRDGYVLLRVLDTIAAGCVAWPSVHKPPFKPLLKQPKSIENCNQVVRIARQVLALPLVNIGGIDIVNGQHKLLLAILWQLMRYNIRGLLQAVSSKGTRISDAELDLEILSWANARVAAAGKKRRISSFHDRSIASGLFLVDLLAAVEPRCIDLAMVTAGTTPHERELNAKYVISIAWKLGCCIFLLWEDVVEVNAKMVLVFVASLMLHTIQRSREPSPAGSPRPA